MWFEKPTIFHVIQSQMHSCVFTRLLFLYAFPFQLYASYEFIFFDSLPLARIKSENVESEVFFTQYSDMNEFEVELRCITWPIQTLSEKWILDFIVSTPKLFLDVLEYKCDWWWFSWNEHRSFRLWTQKHMRRAKEINISLSIEWKERVFSLWIQMVCQ